jgi:hypothetical protein
MIRRIFPGQKASPTIHEFIAAHLDPSGVGLLPGGEDLPDTVRSPNEISWMAGAFDGVGTHHMGGTSEQPTVTEVFDLLRKTIASGLKPTEFGRLYERLLQERVLTILDPVLEIVRGSALPTEGLRRVGHRLATEGRHREPVKFGIALSGLLPGGPERDVLMTLARHEEFTLYCAVAVANTEVDPEPVLWQMAKAVTGWGRIHIVERLRSTKNPEIQQWMLRGGFRNAVMNEYLAYIAATTGDLVDALRGTDIDDALFDAACDIVSALIAGGPAQDIDDYGDAPTTLALLVVHLERRATKLLHFIVADEIEAFLARGDWSNRYEKGWTEQQREDLMRRVQAIKARDLWLPLATESLWSDDLTTFYEADRAARTLGVETFDAYWARIQNDPMHGPWYGAMKQVTEDRIDEVLAFAEQTLPLAAIASGPSDSLGLGPDYAPHHALDFIVQELPRFPGRGWTLVNAALRSSVVRNRNMAINALERWSKSAWPPEAISAVERAAEIEPRDDVKNRLVALTRSTLPGKGLDA